MIPLPANVKLVLGLVLVAGIAALQALSKVEPAWSWAGGVVQALTMLEMFFTVPPATAAKMARLTAAVSATLHSLLFVIGLGYVLTACKGPIYPELQAVEQVVADDLASGATDAQMASDVCKALGGSALTDAVCAGVETVIQDVLQVLLDTQSLSPAVAQRAHEYLGLHRVVWVAP
jgi:hypothetical protein